MQRTKVFIGYSKKDEEYLQAFLVHLKPWEEQGIVDVWSDQRIETSQDWHAEIQQTLASAAVAVLLVSPDFLGTDYIRHHELPYLLRAREDGELDIACLYLRASTVDDDDSAMPVELSSGETLRIKLTKYQALNRPTDVVAALSGHERDALYATAASDLKRLYQRKTRRSPRSPTGKRHELTVQFRLRSHQLTRTYRHSYAHIPPYRSTWQAPDRPDDDAALFEALFGTQEQCDTVLRVLFEADPARPIRYPVRVRIQTDEPELAALRWAETSWEGNVLRDHGWTFELIGETATDFPDITLKAPCPVLMIAPGSVPDTDLHHRALEERLKNAWPFYHDTPPLVRDWEGLEQAWQRRRPRIIYYYGPAESDGKTLTLLFGEGQGQSDRCPVTALTQLWQTQPPEVLFCNIIGGPVAPGTAMANVRLPVIITQHSADAREARRAALEWFHALMETGEDTDPVWALHQHGLSTAVAWGAYGHWQTRTANEPAKDKLARLLLDRRSQRALGRDAVDELVRHDERRVCCVLAYGAEGNLVELFAEQLYEHLRRSAREIALVRRIPLRLPDATSFDVRKLAFEVRRYLGLGERESFGAALARRRPRGPGRARPVLLLDWGARGTTEENRLSSEALQAWLEFCRQQLCAHCPKDMRLVSCLAYEIPTERQTGLRQLVGELRAQARFRDRTFRLVLPEPLDVVEANDLADFLTGPGNTSCPDGLSPEMPELLVHKTRGQFRETVDLVEEAERVGWYELYDELKAESGASTGRTFKRDTLL